MAFFIVLSVHDGQRHLAELIDSVLAQTERDFTLLVRDDGSQDGSRAHLEERARLDGRIEILDDGGGRVGTCASYSRLLGEALSRGAGWVSLCDQDDVWRPDKIAAHRRDISANRARPQDVWLYHSDLIVVDDALRTIHESHLRYAGLRHQDAGALRTLLVQNFVTGCSSVVSRGLLEGALPVPGDAVMHDWWLALWAAAVGRIGFAPAPQVLYRQHPENQLGAKGYRQSLLDLLKRSLSARRHPPDEFVATLAQARALERRLAERGAGGDAKELVSKYLSLFEPETGRTRRVAGLVSLGIGRQDRIRDWALKLKLLTTPWPPDSSQSTRSS